MKKVLIIMLIITIISSLASCTKPEDRIKGHAMIDWVDFINLNGKSYHSIHSAILSDTAKVKQVIGEVRFQVADVVSNPEYRTKDGDAAYWPKGTKIYALEGYSDFSIVAVKDSHSINGYRLYYEFIEKQPYKWNYEDLPKDKVNKIEIYTMETYNNQKLVKMISKKSEIAEFIAILDKGEKYELVNSGLDTSHGHNIVFHTNEIYALRNMVYFDGKRYYWSPWDIMILPESFNKYMNIQ